ncbi:MAG: OmpA family protein [Candidatus Thiodiazotropha sp. (ex Codakia rugifera)]|nr:OmpA family protein [Candidatus Thiodiazotropha sp. (ex Codakia rugifera)]
MKKYLIVLTVICSLQQQPLLAGEPVDEVEKAIRQGSVVGLLVGGLVGGPPGAVMGFTGGAMVGELEARKHQLKALNTDLDVIQTDRAREQQVAAEHESVFRQQRVFQQAKVDALQQGYSFCLGFRSNRTEIEPVVVSQLNALVSILQAFPELELRIEAGADIRGSEIHNQILSKQRAEAVADLLMAAGLPGERIVTRYIGKAEARYPIHDLEGLAFDRMVQLTLIKGEGS